MLRCLSNLENKVKMIFFLLSIFLLENVDSLLETSRAQAEMSTAKWPGHHSLIQMN